MQMRAHGPDQSVSFTIPGDVVPWARAGGGKSVARFTPRRQRYYKAVIIDYASRAIGNRPLIDVPCELKILAYYPWPKSWSRKKREACGGWKPSKPDTDNIAKIVKDAMNNVVYTDDARVCSAHIWKKFTDDKPCLKVEVRPLVSQKCGDTR